MADYLSEAIFILQLIAVVSIGGFIGEFYRLAVSGGTFNKLFMAKFLAGAFLSGLVGFILYSLTNKRPLCLAVAALLSYQEESVVSKIGQNVVENILNVSIKGKKDKDGEQ